MSDINPNCDGAHCRDPNGEVRAYPKGGGSNLILCQLCFAHENAYMLHQQRKHWANVSAWPTRDWNTARRYPE